MSMTFRRTAFATLALAVVAAAAPQAARAGNRDFTLANSLPWTAAAVYVRPAGTAAWSSDLLGRDVLPSGSSTKLRLGQGAQCLFDVKLALTNGAAIDVPEFQRLDLCTLDRMTVFFDGAFKARLVDVQ